jgi:hypothetical protein
VLLVWSPALPRLLSLPSDLTPFVAATVTARFGPAPATHRAADYRLDSIFLSSPDLMAGNRRFCCPAMNPSHPRSRRCLRLLQLLYVVSTATISPVLLPPVRARSGRAWMNGGCQNAASTASYSAGDSYSGDATSVSFSSCSW